jgi:hypothetical protein
MVWGMNEWGQLFPVGFKQYKVLPIIKLFIFLRCLNLYFSALSGFDCLSLLNVLLQLFFSFFYSLRINYLNWLVFLNGFAKSAFLLLKEKLIIKELSYSFYHD